jgi:NAD(P)H-hydrate epimerase
MELLATAEQMQEYDRSAITRLSIPGLLLMENAGRAFVDELQKRAGSLARKQIIVVCGKGNNGGDGLVIARHCANRGALVHVFLLTKPSSLQGDSAVNYAAVKKISRMKNSGLRLSLTPTAARFAPRGPVDIIVDAIFGTGFSGSARGVFAEAIDWINRAKAFVASVDVPSGVNGTTGIVESSAVRADLTVTMGLAKIGHHVGEGRERSGEVVVADISMPPALFQGFPTQTMRVLGNDVRRSLPTRPQTAHKYSVGKVFVLGGSRNFTGAPTLAALSVLRAGAGAVVLGVPASIHPMLVRKLTEVILLPLPETESGTIAASALASVLEKCAWADAVALGPGLSRNAETDALLLNVLNDCRAPVVLDADGLSALAGKTGILRERPGPTILTPHTGELGRLIGHPAEEIELRRVEIARESARKLHSILVLKGSPTVTAIPKGVTYLNSTGNPGMATIGSGDVLTGVIASLLAQGMDPATAAWSGVWIHGRAGDLSADRLGQRSLMAGDILEAIAEVLHQLE